ncbi:MAG: aromatic-ring-hydroxylating dioxygenase subunit beta [Betaproteobacteria bacterium]
MAEHHDLLEAGREVLALEAAALDEQRWDDWLALFAPDCEYWVPTWVSEDTLASDHQSQLSQIYYSSRAGLEDRIARIRTGKSPASTPLRRTTHMTSNVVLLPGAAGGGMALRSSWTCHVFDPNSKKTYVLFGHANHELRFTEAKWLIARKKTVVQNDYLPTMVDVYCI